MGDGDVTGIEKQEFVWHNTSYLQSVATGSICKSDSANSRPTNGERPVMTVTGRSSDQGHSRDIYFLDGLYFLKIMTKMSDFSRCSDVQFA